MKPVKTQNYPSSPAIPRAACVDDFAEFEVKWSCNCQIVDGLSMLRRRRRRRLVLLGVAFAQMLVCFIYGCSNNDMFVYQVISDLEFMKATVYLLRVIEL
ncbi:hypothetical protein NC652_000721 [Populus alba x Populus x berolinensis]|nr:hypothetical protein NC652_000721 [Populus alba x Populus x berolinensis]